MRQTIGKVCRAVCPMLLAALLLFCSCGGKPDHNETEGSNLGHWGRGLSAVLVGRYDDLSVQWFGCLSGREAQTRCASILRDDFQIAEREGLIRQLQFALRSGAREDYRYDADALALLQELPPEEYEAALAALSPEGRTRYQIVAANAEQWGDLGLLGWDLATVSLLSQLGYTAGYLTHEEAQAAIEPAAQVARQYFDDWSEFCNNVLDGEALELLLPPDEPDGGYAARAAKLEELTDGQEADDLLFDDALFEQEPQPLAGVSHTDLLG